MKQGPRRQQSVADRERQKAAISSPVQLFPQLGDWESAIQSEGQNVRLRQALDVRILASWHTAFAVHVRDLVER